MASSKEGRKAFCGILPKHSPAFSPDLLIPQHLRAPVHMPVYISSGQGSVWSSLFQLFYVSLLPKISAINFLLHLFLKLKKAFFSSPVLNKTCPFLSAKLNIPTEQWMTGKSQIKSCILNVPCRKWPIPRISVLICFPVVTFPCDSHRHECILASPENVFATLELLDKLSKPSSCCVCNYMALQPHSCWFLTQLPLKGFITYVFLLV